MFRKMSDESLENDIARARMTISDLQVNFRHEETGVHDKYLAKLLAERKKREVKAWLAEYPEIGVLNNGTYYVIIEGEQQQVAELCPPIFLDIEA